MGVVANERTREKLEELLVYLEFLAELPGPRTSVQILDTSSSQPVTGRSWHGGLPRGVAPPRWPRHPLDADLGDDVDVSPDDDRMAHVVTLEAAAVEVAGVPGDAGAIVLFTPSLRMPADPLIDGFFVSRAEMEATGDEAHPPMRESRYAEPCGIQLLDPIEVPLALFVVCHIGDFEYYREVAADEPERLAAFDELFGGPRRFSADELQALRDAQCLLKTLPYVGGRHLRLQPSWETAPGELQAASSSFVMQFGEELAGINCGDHGAVYVSGDAQGLVAEWESH